MKPPSFGYQLAQDLPDAFAHYAAATDDVLWLAGGHSIVPSLALRLQAPGLLIDISRLPELAGITVSDDGLRIGATTRHAELLSNPLVAEHAPMLAQAAHFVAHPAIRNHATFGGNLALADPASEFPAVVRCLGGMFDIVGPDGERTVAAEDFFLDLYTTAIEPGEILRSILIPPAPPGTLTAFDELARRHGDYAMVGAAVRLVMDDGLIGQAGLCFHSVGATPIRAENAEAALVGHPLDDATITAARDALAQDLDPADEPTMPGATRLHLAEVLLGRILSRLATPAP
ncbi:FAD binding domain-containing protein [Sphingomonas arantia]|uniref:FAD binding domain-containing protein n=1 Tax=Sphingomonas arantia TaxID=1460676 RepID=A0ABW4U2H8_9SPHN